LTNDLRIGHNKAHKLTPAIAAGISDNLWSVPLSQNPARGTVQEKSGLEDRYGCYSKIRHSKG